VINWEAGILGALRPVLSAHGIELRTMMLWVSTGNVKRSLRAGEYTTYRQILRE